MGNGSAETDILTIPVTLGREELRTRLLDLKPAGGWRHRIDFSNGLTTADLGKGPTWTEAPLNKIRMVEAKVPDFARRGGRALDIGSNIGHNSLYLA